MNLCTNAAHAMQKTGGVMGVSLGNVRIEESQEFQDVGLEPGPYVQLTVSDTGSGMDAATLARIFDPFLRPSPSVRAAAWGWPWFMGSCRAWTEE